MDELTRDQQELLRGLGRKTAEIVNKKVSQADSGYSRVIGKVTKVTTSNRTCSVNTGSDTYPITFDGIPYTSSCMSIAVGKTVIVETVSHIALVTGVIEPTAGGTYNVVGSLNASGNLTVSGTGTFGNRAATMNGLAFIGTNPITSTAQDTCAYWTSVGNCVCYFENKTATNGQPFTYGFLINLVRNTEIHQEFWEQHGFDSRSSQSCHWFRATNTNQAAMPAWSSGGLDAYPVGAVYISYVSTSPAELLGGSWTQITDRFLRMANDVNTGGADTHTLTEAQMPSHQHGNSSNWKWECSTGFNTGGYNIPSASKGNAVTSGVGFYAGGGGAHNNMPAYQDLYAWRRTG